MELRTYWSVIMRRLWIIILVVIIALGYIGYQFYHLEKTPGALKAYQTAVTIRIGLSGAPPATDHDYYDYISASESLADTFTTGPILTSDDFANQVIQQVQAEKGEVTQRFSPNSDLGTDIQNSDSIKQAISATRDHSLVTLSVTWATPAGAWAIADAVGQVCATHMSSYVNYEVHAATPTTQHGQQLASVDSEVVGTIPDPQQVAGLQSNKLTLLLGLLLVALIIGLALAFLIEYLDDRIQTREELEQFLQLPLYGEIPRTSASGKTTGSS